MNIFLVLIVINVVAYSAMVLDKLKSVYKWWRIPERSLWILASIGGVFGIWLGMRHPLYHKAGKREFRLWIPVIAVGWMIIGVYLFSVGDFG